MATATGRPKVKPQFYGQVVSNDGDTAVVQYEDGESRELTRFLGQKEVSGQDWRKVFQEAKPAATPEDFLKVFPVGQYIVDDWRPNMRYGMMVKRPNSTSKKMTVGDLIRELQSFPLDALALISVDEERNWHKHLYQVIGGTFGEDERFEGRHDLKPGDPYVIIWPHG